MLPKDSEEFKRLVEYVKNTHGATHTMHELEVMEIFKVARHGEEERFKSCLPPFTTDSSSGMAPGQPTSVVFSHR